LATIAPRFYALYELKLDEIVLVEEAEIVIHMADKITFYHYRKSHLMTNLYSALITLAENLTTPG
jgi:hypothetical protein